MAPIVSNKRVKAVCRHCLQRSRSAASILPVRLAPGEPAEVAMPFVTDTLQKPRPDSLAGLQLPRRERRHPSPVDWRDEVL